LLLAESLPLAEILDCELGRDGLSLALAGSHHPEIVSFQGEHLGRGETALGLFLPIGWNQLSSGLLRLDFTPNGASIGSTHAVLKRGYLKVAALDNSFAISLVCAGIFDSFVRIYCIAGLHTLAAERLPE
jgi:hypothetical protein